MPEPRINHALIAKICSSPDPIAALEEAIRPAQALVDSMLNENPEAFEMVSDTGRRHICAELHRKSPVGLMLRLATQPELEPVPDIARKFVELIREECGDNILKEIDRLNADEINRDACHSHGYCDANMFMDAAVFAVTGRRPSAELPHLTTLTDDLWQNAWEFAKLAGFHNLAAPKGRPDDPPEPIDISLDPGNRLSIALPGTAPLTGYPLEVEVDYYGRNPHLQLLCRNHNDEEGEPKVCVRYNRAGEVCEVILGDPRILVVRALPTEPIKEFHGTGETPWEIEREGNPACADGDRLQCPSGQVGTVMRLRTRYDDDIEQFRAYSEMYGILERLDSYPGSDPRHGVYDSVEQAWEVNPLTVGTTDPGDFSTVPEHPTPTTNGRQED